MTEKNVLDLGFQKTVDLDFNICYELDTGLNDFMLYENSKRKYTLFKYGKGETDHKEEFTVSKVKDLKAMIE